MNIPPEPLVCQCHLAKAKDKQYKLKHLYGTTTNPTTELTKDNRKEMFRSDKMEKIDGAGAATCYMQLVL